MASIETTLKKLDGPDVPRVKKCAIAYSGGLDSTLGIELLRRVYKAEEIIPINVDVGQGEEEREMAKSRAEKLNITPVLLDAQKEFSDNWLRKAIKANSDYFGYPVSTSMTRAAHCQGGVVEGEGTRLRLHTGGFHGTGKRSVPHAQRFQNVRSRALDTGSGKRF